MFWSLVLEPGKRYSSTVSESFHLSMATLDTKTCKSDTEVYPVIIEVDGCERILCNLSKSQIPQSNLDLVFEKGSDITFSTNGKATIHLTGYCIQDEPMEDDDDEYFSDSDEEDESFSELVNAKNASSQLKSEGKSKNTDKQNANKRKQNLVEAISKKKLKSAQVESDEDEDEDDSDSDDSSADLDESKLDQLMGSVTSEADSSDDSELDDEEDADDSEGEDEVDDEDDDDDDDDDDDEEDDDESEDEKPKPKPSTKQEIKTPVSNKQKTPVSNKKQDKQQNKSQLTNGVTPQSNKKDKNKNQANQPTPKQDGQKTPNKDAQKTPKKGEPSPSSQKRTLSGGVVVEEIKPGNGPPAKYGKNVQVYYTGRLKNNNRVFDKTVDGPGFKFRLGNNEVIKGWDVALNGMKVGGKRRITIPPAMAYGNKGSPPTIPANSWLVFDVELKSVN